MAGTETKRIIELTEASTVQSGDFIAVDSNARGTKKVSTNALATSAALTAETNARAGADEQMSERMDGIEEQTALIQNPTKTLSGALVSFTDGADMPMVACSAEIVPKQSGTGTPSPSNVRAISGWESVDVYDTGVNVWDEEMEDGFFSTSNGAKIANNAVLRSANMTSCKPNTDIYVKISGACSFMWYGANKEYLGYRGTVNANTVVTIPDNVHYFNFGITKANYGHNAYNNDISINYPSTDHDYHAYNGTTTPVNLGRTVYGGTLDVVSGVLTVDMKYDQMTYSYLSGLGSGYIGFSANVTQVGGNAVWVRNWNYTDYPENIDGGIKAVCNAFPISMHNKNIINSQYRTWFGVGSMTSVAEFLSAVQTLEANGSGLWIAHEIKTPQTYTLTGQEVSTLLGDNNVWADSGDVEITYRRDISIVLENLENALSGSNSLNTMMMSAPTENTAEEPTEDEAEDDMR